MKNKALHTYKIKSRNRNAIGIGKLIPLTHTYMTSHFIDLLQPPQSREATVLIKTQLSNLVHTTRFWNNLRQNRMIDKPNNLKFSEQQNQRALTG